MFPEKMNDLFGMLDGSLRTSITDSTMMWIVHYAMDKAHGKVKSNSGVFHRLNEISKFYELAVIQLEGCMRFVQEEADGGNLESCHEKVLADLTEIRDRLLGRLEESELAIMEKDRELIERFENELRLKQALELRDRELVSFDEDRGDDQFSEDQHVVELEQQPEERNVNAIATTKDNKKIEQMGFDIHFLKETMDHAFGKMQDAIFLSEQRPQEKKWRWTIEKETMAALIKGFLMDFKENFEVEMRKKEEQVSSMGLSEHLSNLINEAVCLRNELESLIDLNEAQRKANHSNHDSGLPPKAAESSTDEVVGQAQLHGDEPEKDSSHVAKMIKSHESIIRRKSEELSWLKREILREKGCSSSSRREKNPVSLKGRIQDIITRLDNLIECNSKLVKNFGDYGGDRQKEGSPTKKMEEYIENSAANSLEDVWEKMNSALVSNAVDEQLIEKLEIELRMSKQENEDGDLVTMIMEETYATIFRGLMGEFYAELHAHSFESLIRDCAYGDFLEGVIDKCKEDVKTNQIESQNREEIHYIVCGEMVKDFCAAVDGALVRKVSEKGCSVGIKSHEIAECSVKEEVYMAFFRQVIDEWKMEIDARSLESLIREDMHRFIVVETAKEACIEAEGQKQCKTSEHFLADGNADRCLEGKVDDIVKVDDQINPKAAIVHDGKSCICQQRYDAEFNINQFDPIMEFPLVFANFEILTHLKLGNTFSRLEGAKHLLDSLVEHVSSIQKRELLYKEAFFLRCKNLEKAETEVDLLGDQVHVLLGLLEKIYRTLHQYSPLLQQHFPVSEILNLIRKELHGSSRR